MKRFFTLFGLAFSAAVLLSPIVNSQPYVINDKYLSINGTDFAFFGWLVPYDESGADLKPIVANINGQEISLSPWFDCSEDYYKCAASYIKYFYLPYLYWQFLNRNYDYQSNLNFKYSGLLSEVINVNCPLPYSKDDYSLEVAFTKVNDSFYYKDKKDVYFSILPVSPSLIDPQTNLTNTQYYFADNPKFVLKVSQNKTTIISYDLLSYPDFYLYKGLPSSTSLWKIVKDNLKDQRIFSPLNSSGGLAINSSSRGYFKLSFANLVKSPSNRYFGVEYQPVVNYKISKDGSSESSYSEMKSYYTFVEGPNSVVYLKSIKIK